MVMGKEYKQLKVEEREKIAFYYAQRKSVREIARLVERDHSTVSRELRRNRCPVHWTDYRPYRAQLSAEKRNRVARTHARLKNDSIRTYVAEKLKLGWSPEQITGRICLDYPELSISHEAIYQYLYIKAKPLIVYLARRHRRRYKRPACRKHQTLIESVLIKGLRRSTNDNPSAIGKQTPWSPKQIKLPSTSLLNAKAASLKSQSFCATLPQLSKKLS